MSVLNRFIQETEAMASAETASNVVPFLEGKAARIRKLMESAGKDILAIGKELMEAREAFPVEAAVRGGFVRPGWAEWVKQEFDYTADHAGRLIKVWEAFGSLREGSTERASFEVLEYLLRPFVSEEGRQEVIAIIEGGERVTKARAKKIVAEHAPPPSKARKIARETKKPTLASDGNIYFGATKEEEKQIEERRQIVFDVRRAVDTLSAMKKTPTEFLKYGLSHQLWNKQEEHKIGEAAAWLNALVAAWERR